MDQYHIRMCIRGEGVNHINPIAHTYGMEYVIRAKGPALGPVRPFSADRREKRNKTE